MTEFNNMFCVIYVMTQYLAGLTDVMMYVHRTSEAMESAVVSGEELHMDRNSLYTVICEAFGSNPAPNLKILIGDWDISSEFQTEETKHLQGQDGDGALRAVTYDVIKTKTDFKPTRDMHDKMLTCKGIVPEMPDKIIQLKRK